MAITAAITFSQGGTSTPAGQAMLGAVGVPVTVANGSDIGVTSWEWTLLSVPPGSALSTGIFSTSPTGVFTPDVEGQAFLIRLTVTGVGREAAVDMRAFGIIGPMGWLIPAFLGDHRAHNFDGQTRGWAGTDSTKMLDAMLSYWTEMLSGASNGDVLTYDGTKWGPGEGGGGGGGGSLPTYVELQSNVGLAPVGTWKDLITYPYVIDDVAGEYLLITAQMLVEEDYDGTSLARVVIDNVPVGDEFYQTGVPGGSANSFSSFFLAQASAGNRVIKLQAKGETGCTAQSGKCKLMVWGIPLGGLGGGGGTGGGAELTNTPPPDVFVTTAAAGTSAFAARGNHQHNVKVAAASALTVGGTSKEGASTSLARADHAHELPAFGTTKGTFCEGDDSRIGSGGSSGLSIVQWKGDPISMDDTTLNFTGSVSSIVTVGDVTTVRMSAAPFTNVSDANDIIIWNLAEDTQPFANTGMGDPLDLHGSPATGSIAKLLGPAGDAVKLMTDARLFSYQNALGTTCDEFTLHFWLKVDQIPTGPGAITDIGGHSNAIKFKLDEYDKDHVHTPTLRLLVFYSYIYWVTAEAHIQLNTWMHVAMTYVTSTGVVKLFINGDMIDATFLQEGLRTLFWDTTPWSLGWNFGWSSCYFSDIRVCSVARGEDYFTGILNNPGGAISVLQKDGKVVSKGDKTLNMTGSAITKAASDGVGTTTFTFESTPLTMQKDGKDVSTVDTKLNLTGTGVTSAVSDGKGTTTYTITAGGGGGGLPVVYKVGCGGDWISAVSFSMTYGTELWPAKTIVVPSGGCSVIVDCSVTWDGGWTHQKITAFILYEASTGGGWILADSQVYQVPSVVPHTTEFRRIINLAAGTWYLHFSMGSTNYSGDTPHHSSGQGTYMPVSLL